MVKYLSVDLEMTGNEPGWHEIIQIGAVLLDENFDELAHYESNVYPENEESFSIPAERIHDLSIAELDEAPMLHEVMDEFEDWIITESRLSDRHQLKKIIICGQSVINDINFLRFAYRQEKLSWPFAYQLIDLHNVTYFLFEILKANNQQIPRYRNLNAIADFFGLEREGEHHNALEDAQITAKCLQHVFAYKNKLKL